MMAYAMKKPPELEGGFFIELGNLPIYTCEEWATYTN